MLNVNRTSWIERLAALSGYLSLFLTASFSPFSDENLPADFFKITVSSKNMVLCFEWVFY